MASVVCRQVVPLPEVPSEQPEALDPGGLLALEEDLIALVAEGMLSVEMDLEGTQRFRPVEEAA